MTVHEGHDLSLHHHDSSRGGGGGPHDDIVTIQRAYAIVRITELRRLVVEGKTPVQEEEGGRGGAGAANNPKWSVRISFDVSGGEGKMGFDRMTDELTLTFSTNVCIYPCIHFVRAHVSGTRD